MTAGETAHRRSKGIRELRLRAEATAAEADPGVGDLVVGYRDETGAGHHQRWNEGVLLAWEEHPAAIADIEVVRTGAVDLADIDAALPSQIVTASSSLTFLDLTHRDILGTTGVDPKETDGWSIASTLATLLTIPDGPFGPAAVRMTWEHNALLLDWTASGPSELHMEVPYELALRWMWGELLLGNLFAHGLRPQASSLFVLSEVEGLVSAPSLRPPPPGMVDLLLRFRAARHLSWPAAVPSVPPSEDGR